MKTTIIFSFYSMIFEWATLTQKIVIFDKKTFLSTQNFRIIVHLFLCEKIVQGRGSLYSRPKIDDLRPGRGVF